MTKQMFGIKVDKELREKIRKVAKEKGLTSSAWVRMLVIEKLEEMEKQQ